jgi:hypothetical protein
MISAGTAPQLTKPSPGKPTGAAPSSISNSPIQAIFANLFDDDDGDYRLIWSRPNGRRTAD